MKALKSASIGILIIALASLLLCGIYIYNKRNGNVSESKHDALQATSNVSSPEMIVSSLKEILGHYQEIIVLLAGEERLSESDRTAAEDVARALFHENLTNIDKVNADIHSVIISPNPARFEIINSILQYIESDSALYDADRLAFSEVLRFMQSDVANDTSLTAITEGKRISEDLDALADIQHNYDKEITKIFSRFETRAIELKRQRWEDYVTHLQKLYSRDKILKDYGVILPYQSALTIPAEKSRNVFTGRELPPKTVVLTFDDGPHPKYTEEIVSILKQYDVPAIFFEVGRNLGTINGDGSVTLSDRADISRKLEKDGFIIGNHSYSHPVLSKKTGKELLAEITNTDLLLKAIDANRPPLFRFPYGAYNAEAMKDLEAANLKSVLWNVDSLDWADPVPNSIANRVLSELGKENRGIVLFHDIHERAISALPIVLDHLIADGYQFATWDGTTFKVTKTETTAPLSKDSLGLNAGKDWALVIGIDQYAKWPKLQYAVRDAEAIKQILIDKLGFSQERVFTIENEAATRNGILSEFRDKLSEGKVNSNDRLFVFYAGHGATRKLSSGRDLGYIVPVDSDPNNLSIDAIPMTEIQDVSENLPAKQILFIMDACYSGLGLERGMGSENYLRDNSKRIGRQMITAGGADQMVADGGPNGHSVFTWTLLQGLSGKADLNNDGFITATELAAYVAPAVASVSQQTPAFGSLQGSEGGEYIFTLSTDNEYINAQTEQLPNEAIALNNKLDASRISNTSQQKALPQPTQVAVKDLQGKDQNIVVPQPIKQTPHNLAQIANDKGLMLYREKQYAAAEAQFTEALKLRPDFALAANNLGFIYFRQNRFAEAARWFENAVKLDPKRAVAYLNAGDAYEQIGDVGNARRSYQKYIDLAPNGTESQRAQQQLIKLKN